MENNVSGRAVEGMSLQPLACGFAVSNPAGGMDVCLLWVVCCQEYVSSTGLSLVQRSPAEYVCVCVCVCVSECYQVQQ